MSITPYLPDRIRQGNVFTWVNSLWKFGRLPGQFSAEINSPLGGAVWQRATVADPAKVKSRFGLAGRGLSG
jgi:hypothetical protein